MTTARLADLVNEHGVSMNATTVTKIEKKDRRVTVDELVALAVALGVSPPLLLLPIERPEGERAGGDSEIPLTDGQVAEWEAAWRWMHGQRPLDDAGEREVREFWFTNRPYESDNPADEAALVMDNRIQGAWRLELSSDGPGQLLRPGRGNLWTEEET